MKVTRGSNSAAVSEIAAKRSPIGNAAIFLTQRTPGSRSIRVPGAQHAPRQRAAAGGAARRGARLGGCAARSCAAAGAPLGRGEPGGVERALDRRLLGVADHARLAGAEGEVGEVARGLQRDRGAGERPHGVAGAARADRQAGEADVLLRAVEDRVQPGAELGERARVAGELAVDAVGGERGLQQDRARDEAPALARGERRPRPGTR